MTFTRQGLLSRRDRSRRTGQKTVGAFQELIYMLVCVPCHKTEWYQKAEFSMHNVCGVTITTNYIDDSCDEQCFAAYIHLQLTLPYHVTNAAAAIDHGQGLAQKRNFHWLYIVSFPQGISTFCLRLTMLLRPCQGSDSVPLAFHRKRDICLADNVEATFACLGNAVVPWSRRDKTPEGWFITVQFSAIEYGLLNQLCTTYDLIRYCAYSTHATKKNTNPQALKGGGTMLQPPLARHLIKERQNQVKNNKEHKANGTHKHVLYTGKLREKDKQRDNRRQSRAHEQSRLYRDPHCQIC